MYQLTPLLIFSAVAAATGIHQHPLGEALPNLPLILKPKDLVDSSALEAHITEENLLKRANKLYEIAELGINEYNHPTRVIGSKGMELNLSASLASANSRVI